MAVPTFVSESAFAVDSSHNPAALFTVSAISLAANVAVAVYQVHRIVTRRLHPLTAELYRDLPAYRHLVESTPGPDAGAVVGAVEGVEGVEGAAAGRREPAPVG